MIKIFSIAYGTFLEALRGRLLAGLVSACVVVLAVSVFLPALHPDDRLKIMLNLHLSSLTLLASFTMASFMAPALPRDMEERTLYPILVKPVRRWSYLQGRLLGSLSFGLLSIYGVSLMGLAFLMAGFPDLVNKGMSAHPVQYSYGSEDDPRFGGEGLFILNLFPKEKLWLNEKGNHTATWRFNGLDRLPEEPESLEILLDMDRINANTLASAAKIGVRLIGSDSKTLLSRETYLEEKGMTFLALPPALLAGRKSVSIELRPLEAPYFISVSPDSVRLAYRGGSSLWGNYFRASTGAFFASAMIAVVALAASTLFSQKMAVAVTFFTYVAGNTLLYLRSFLRLLGSKGEAFPAIPGIEESVMNSGTLENLPFKEWLIMLRSPIELFCDLFPDFQRFNLTRPLIEGVFIEYHLIWQAFLYLITYSIPLFIGAVVIFHWRELR